MIMLLTVYILSLFIYDTAACFLLISGAGYTGQPGYYSSLGGCSCYTNFNQVFTAKHGYNWAFQQPKERRSVYSGYTDSAYNLE